VAALIALICLPRLGQDCLEVEDRKFRTILEIHGYKTEQMGMRARSESYDLRKMDVREGVSELY
jgi:hypothetical protein